MWFRRLPDSSLRLRLPLHCERRYQPTPMIDVERKKMILQAEQEFERKENLSRALADKGVTLFGRITSPPPPEDTADGAPDKA